MAAANAPFAVATLETSKIAEMKAKARRRCMIFIRFVGSLRATEMPEEWVGKLRTRRPQSLHFAHAINVNGPALCR